MSGSHTTSPYTVILTGLITGQPYVCGCWFKYVRPDSVIAYGASINASAIPT
jgi:hypothetical protein